MKKNPTGFTLSKTSCVEYLADFRNDADFLNAHIVNDQPNQIIFALSVLARARGMSVLSKKTGISRDGLYKALSKSGNPSFITVMRIMNGLELRFTVRTNKS